MASRQLELMHFFGQPSGKRPRPASPAASAASSEETEPACGACDDEPGVFVEGDSDLESCDDEPGVFTEGDSDLECSPLPTRRKAEPPAGPVRRGQASVVDGIKLMWGTEPIEWTDEKTGRPMTNVTYVCWDKSRNKWRVQKVNDAGKKVHVAQCATLADAVEKRRDVVDGVIGPGELVVRADGTVGVDKCSHCCRPFPLAHFTPAPCLTNLQLLPRFEACASALASEDASERDAAWAAMRVKPERKAGREALRTSECFACREGQHKSQTEGGGHVAACYAMAQTIRADMARRGCDHPGCTETRPECLEGDHVDRADKRCGRDTCTSYSYFASNYGAKGPEEMWKAYQALRQVTR